MDCAWNVVFTFVLTAGCRLTWPLWLNLVLATVRVRRVGRLVSGWTSRGLLWICFAVRTTSRLLLLLDFVDRQRWNQHFRGLRYRLLCAALLQGRMTVLRLGWRRKFLCCPSAKLTTRRFKCEFAESFHFHLNVLQSVGVLLVQGFALQTRWPYLLFDFIKHADYLRSVPIV